MVVFAKGVPRKSDYRRFRIQTVQGADDYRHDARDAAPPLARACGARAGRSSKARQQAPAEDAARRTSKEDSWALLPDLLIVDGGKGQLHAALEVLREFQSGGTRSRRSAWPSRRRRSFCPAARTR